MSLKNELLENLDKLHTTELGVVRIKRNLSLDVEDVVAWCRDKIKSDAAVITRNGKNWYINIDACIITVNAYSYTIITAHKEIIRINTKTPLYVESFLFYFVLLITLRVYVNIKSDGTVAKGGGYEQ